MESNPPLDRRAIASALFLPALYWTSVVIAITLFGYPGVVCMTPVAWLLGLPVGMRVGRESESPPGRVILEAALAGGLLGAWEGLLFAVVVAASPYLPGQFAGDLPSPFFVAVLWIVLSVPVCGGLAALLARRIQMRKQA
jgi:hypothetical protein